MRFKSRVDQILILHIVIKRLAVARCKLAVVNLAYKLGSPELHIWTLLYALIRNTQKSIKQV